tara:strand:- start:1548 stop:1919 length:372 start_codon:yes stop_codon:yes gene_type:complete
MIDMRKSIKIKCVITDKESFFSGEYLTKKIKEYGCVESLESYYVCREVKTLLNKGYKISEIRNILNVNSDIQLPSSDVIDIIESKYKKTKLKLPAINENLTGFTYNKSDVDVENFINSHIINV